MSSFSNSRAGFLLLSKHKRSHSHFYCAATDCHSSKIRTFFFFREHSVYILRKNPETHAALETNQSFGHISFRRTREVSGDL